MGTHYEGANTPRAVQVDETPEQTAPRLLDRLGRYCCALVFVLVRGGWIAPVNYTWPGRFHLIVRPRLFYITLWFRGKRYHFCEVRNNE